MHTQSYINEADSAERRQEKLEKIVEVLMRRVERDTDQSSPNYSHFQAAIVLEKQVRSRTKDLGEALESLADVNAKLLVAKAEAEAARSDLANALEAIREGFALFDPNDQLVMRNSRFCAYLPDVVDKMESGLSFNDYVSIVSASDHIVLDTSRENWIKDRLKAHKRRYANFNVEHKNDRWVQVSEQRTPNNSTAVLQTDVTDMLRIERQERDKLLGTQAAMIRATLDHLNQGIAIFDAGHALLGSNVSLREMLSPPQRLLQTGTRFSTIVDYFLDQATFVEAPELINLSNWVHSEAGRAPLGLRLSSTEERHYDVFCQETPEQGFVISFTDVTNERAAITAMHAVNETLEQRVHERTAELRDARDQAERANTSKSRFVAAVSHDLLQPLNAAKLFIASLKEVGQPVPAQELTQRIENAFESVETILSALLDITKLDSGSHSVDVTAFPVEKVLRSVREEFGHRAVAKGLRLRVRRDQGIVRSDHMYLLRIVQNLVTNAIRYTSSGGVLVATRKRGDHLRIEVWDTGAGISTDHHAEIFQEFRRLDRAGKDEPGMGLGLAIVERACKLLGHELSFSSVEGRGSVFRIDVPLAKPGEVGEEQFSAEPVLTPMVALLIEENQTIRAETSKLLENWGINTIEAENGAEATQLLREVDIIPDVIIVDHVLAGPRDGFSTVSRLRDTYGHLPAVLMSSDPVSELIGRAQSEKLTLLQKPLEPRRLRSILTWLQSSVG